MRTDIAPAPTAPGVPTSGNGAKRGANGHATRDVAATIAGAPRGRRIFRAILLGALPAAALIGGIVWFAARPGETKPAFETATARQGDLAVLVTATGTLAPLDTVDVGTEVSGIVDEVRADYNDRVRRGQVLAVINTDQIQAQILQRRSALAAAEASALQAAASLDEAVAQSTRNESLYAATVLTTQEIESTRASLARAKGADASARAQVASAQASLQAELTALSKATIRSPIDGIVLKRAVEPGRTVTAAFQTPVLFVLAADLRHMTLALDVDEAEVGQVRAGQYAQFTVDAYPDRSYDARLRSVHNAAQTVDGVVTYQALLDVANSDLSLRPGMTATATIRTNEVRDVLLVPNGALRVTMTEGVQAGGERLPPGKARVWVMREGTPVPIVIGTGATDGAWTVVTGGSLARGGVVVVNTSAAATASRPGGFALFGRPPHP